MIRSATAVWNGSLKEGDGTLTTDSEVLNDTSYSFVSRFEDGNGTNPEELIAAAHAGCFSMAFSAMLGVEGITPETITTQADIKLDYIDGTPTITSSHLTTEVVAPGQDQAKLEEICAKAKAGCVISRVLNTNITIEATYQV